MEPVDAFFPQPQQDVQEVLILHPCTIGPFLLLCGRYLFFERICTDTISDIADVDNLLEYCGVTLNFL